MRRNTLTTWLSSALLAAGLCVAPPARAQVQPPPEETPPPDSTPPAARPAAAPAAAPAARPATPTPPARALKRTTGFFLQGQVSFNLNAYGGYYYFGSYNILPILRLGYQARTFSLSAEVNYSTLDFDGDGMHLFSIGGNVQPVLWRSALNQVQLALVVGAGVGTVAGDGDDIILGHINLGVGVHYFPNRHFGVGVEPGLRIQFIQLPNDGDLVTAALFYVALSVEAIIGK